MHAFDVAPFTDPSTFAGVAVAACVLVFRLLRREARVREKMHARMAHDAFHDALTLLPNRRYLFPDDGVDTSSLRAQADRAMYCAKRLGKARVSRAETRLDVSDAVSVSAAA